MCSHDGEHADNVAYPVGQVFLRMLLMTVIPLVFASIVLGVAGLGDLTKLGRVGGRRSNGSLPDRA